MSAQLLRDIASTFDASATAAQAQAECAERNAGVANLSPAVATLRRENAVRWRTAVEQFEAQAKACRDGAAALAREAAQ